MDARSENDRLRADLAEREAVIAKQAKLIAAQTTKVEALEALVLKLTEQLNRNSTNSNLPPERFGSRG